MSTNPPRDEDDSTPDDTDRRSRLGLRTIVDALASAVEQTVADDRIAVHGDVSWGRIDDAESRRSLADRPSRSRSPSVHTGIPQRCALDSRLDDGAFVVTADVRDVDREALSVGLHPRSDEFVIAEAGRTIGRVHLPWSDVDVADARMRNGVLTVRFVPGDA